MVFDKYYNLYSWSTAEADIVQTNATMLASMPPKAQSKSEREENAALGKHIAELRKERGFTQVELAGQLAVSQAVIASYEGGRVRPHPRFILRLAELLEVSTDELLGAQPRKSNNRIPRRILRRVEQVAQLPLAEQKALLKTIDAVVDRHRMRTSAARS